MRTRLGFVMAALLSSCAAPAPKVAAVVPRAAPAVAAPFFFSAERPAELLAAPAALLLLTDAPIAREAFAYSSAPVARLEGGAVGYIDPALSRALATLTEVRRIAGPPELRTACVAEDGKTTFVTSQHEREYAKLWRAERFDAPLELIGENPVAVGNGIGSQQARWVVRGTSDTVLVECQAGKVQRLATGARSAANLSWTDAVQLFRVRPEGKGAEYCVLRTAETGTFTDLPNCYGRTRADGSMSVEKMPPEGRKLRPGQKPPPPICLVLLDRAGKKLRCGVPVGEASAAEAPAARAERAELMRARFYAKDRAVVSSNEGGLFQLGPGIMLEPESRIGAATLGYCTPLLATEPVFSCAGDSDFDVVVSVASDAALKQELHRHRSLGQRGERIDTRFHHTTDGGLAVGGDCSGNLSDAACVRDRAGKWRTVPFSARLIRALNRTAPETRLIPSLDGRLYVGTGTAGGGLGLMTALTGSNVQVLIFQADYGEPRVVKQLPAWILQALSGLSDAPSGNTAGDQLDLSFVGDGRLRAWPLERRHPAFGTSEHCRVDISGDGSFDTACTQGRLFESGKFGLLQKSIEVYETLDAGGSWTRVPLPVGLVTDEIVCTPLGCRIGPYWRAGWGEPTR